MSTEQEKRFQDLQIKNQKVAESAIKINTQIEHAQETRAKLQEAAQKKFGESDLEKLKEMAALWKKENEDRLNAFEQDINNLTIEVQSKSELIKQIQQN
jgi:DNA polymerase III delta prime subunit